MVELSSHETNLSGALRLLLARINDILLTNPNERKRELTEEEREFLDTEKGEKPPVCDVGCQTDECDVEHLRDVETEGREEGEKKDTEGDKESEHTEDDKELPPEVIDPSLVPLGQRLWTLSVLFLFLGLLFSAAYVWDPSAIERAKDEQLQGVVAEMRQKLLENPDEPLEPERIVPVSVNDVKRLVEGGLLSAEKGVALWNAAVAEFIERTRGEEEEEEEEEEKDEEEEEEEEGFDIMGWLADLLNMQSVIYLTGSGLVFSYQLGLALQYPVRPLYNRRNMKRAVTLWMLTLSMAVVLLNCPDGEFVGSLWYTISGYLIGWTVWRFLDYSRRTLGWRRDVDFFESAMPKPPPQPVRSGPTITITEDDTEALQNSEKPKEKPPFPPKPPGTLDSDAVGALNPPATWKRPLPYLPTGDDFEGWEPQQRKELCAPLFAGSHSIVMLADYWLQDLKPREFAAMVYCSLSVGGVCYVLHIFQPSELLRTGTLLSIWLLLVCGSRLVEHKFATEQFRPLWAFMTLCYASAMLVVAVHCEDYENSRAPLFVFMVLFAWSFPYVLLVAIKPDVQYATFRMIMKKCSTWIRTPMGLLGVVIYEAVFISIYLFAMLLSLQPLLPFAIAYIVLGVFMVPVKAIWCVVFHLPLAWLLLATSMRLEELPDSSILEALEGVLFGPLLEYARIILDLHYTAALAGAASLFIGLSHLLTVFWEHYVRMTWETLRVTVGWMYMFALYMCSVLCLALAEEEEHNLLYFAYSAGAAALFLIGLQPFTPVMLNFASATSVAREAIPLSQMGGFVTGDLEVDELEKLGLSVFKSQATAAFKKKLSKTVNKDKKTRPPSGLLVLNGGQLGMWQLVLFLANLRMAHLANENSTVYLVACVGLAYGLHVCLRAHGSILLALLQDMLLLHTAAIIEAPLVAIIALGALSLHWLMGLVTLRITSSYWPPFVLFGLLIGVALAPSVGGIGDAEPSDPWEEKSAQNFLKWSCRYFDPVEFGRWWLNKGVGVDN